VFDRSEEPGGAFAMHPLSETSPFGALLTSSKQIYPAVSSPKHFPRIVSPTKYSDLRDVRHSLNLIGSKYLRQTYDNCYALLSSQIFKLLLNIETFPSYIHIIILCFILCTAHDHTLIAGLASVDILPSNLPVTAFLTSGPQGTTLQCPSPPNCL
jgi:hypothetical protein